MKTKQSLLFLVLMCVTFISHAAKLVEVKVLDKDYIMLYFLDGEVVFPENVAQLGSRLYTSSTHANDNELITYGTALNTTNAAATTNWRIKSNDDSNFGTVGKTPLNVYRKSKLSGMSQENWNTGTNDYNYDWAYEHVVFLRLPNSMQQGKTYTVEINANTNSDITSKTFVYDIFSSKSEAVRVNIAGYLSNESIKSADVYMWMGDGGARDYAAFEGNDVFIYDVHAKTSQKVGNVSFWKASAGETTHGHQMIRSNVWNADFTGFFTPGTYRLAVEGIGCSEEFEIKADAYSDPFRISTLGFFYMRIGQDNLDMTPVPRRPLYIPGVSPANTVVYITTMHPYHANWDNLCGGDKWDCKDEWAAYSTGRTNPNAYGGHSDALDWDRHLGHVSIIYDLLLPYFLSDGALSDDDMGIAESGNGIPDVLDEARNEVDFWLRLRDGKGYSHGLNNPNNSNVLYQGGNTAVAAWANAANASMLANCFQIAGNTTLFETYRDSAINAYTYASGLTDQMLNKTQGIGAGDIRGRDLKATAAAFLYNITGNTTYENDLNSLSSCTSTTSTIQSGSQNQLYAVAAYLFTKQTVNYPTLYNNMKASLIAEAKNYEANYSTVRPSRRATDNAQGWFVTEMVIQRTIIAHAISEAGANKTLFENALILEADWTLGRNPLNMIQMTTATTNLAHKKSVPNAYTSGWNDGTPGVHPGHTPYMNIDNWGGGMVMGNPTWMTDKNYPSTKDYWPYGEMYYNTRYVYAANEFTPQQTMRGKQALYGYLHAISPAAQQGCATPILTAPTSICGLTSAVLETGLTPGGKTITWYKDDVIIPGQTNTTLTITEGGVYKVKVDSLGCVKTAQKSIASHINVQLGDNKNLCAETEFVLDAGNATIPNVTYQWSTGATTQTITVTKPGTYSVTVTAANCPNASDQITITSQLLNVIGDTICEAGTATLQILGTENYAWFTNATGGVAVEIGNTFTPIVSETTTFYAAESGGFSANLGKLTQSSGEKWNMGNDFESEDKMNKVTVLKAVTLESIAVFVTANNTNVTINMTQNGTVVHTATVTGLSIGKQTIPLNFFLIPGEYLIDAVGSTGGISFEASDANFPYSYAEYISFTYNISWQSGWYGFFYDWKIAIGSACARTPVVAVVDPTHASCSGDKTQNIALQKGWNLISTYIDASDKSIGTLFAGLDVAFVKNADVFWKQGLASELNLLKNIEPGKGYLVYMNSAGVFSITGSVSVESSYITSLHNGWNMIGSPCTNELTSIPFSHYFNAANSQTIKNFEGFWSENDPLSSIHNFEPGKGYFILK